MEKVAVKEMTKEEIAKELESLKNERQEIFADKLLEDVKWLCEKAMKVDYKPTQKERCNFNEIRKIINNMNNWF